MNNSGDKYLCVQNLRIFSFYLSFLLHQLTIHVTSDTPPPYTPHDNIALDCGSFTNSTTFDTRPWIGDYIDPEISLSESQNNKSTTSEAPQQPKSGDKVPYITARLSYSPFTYVFPLTSGQKFIRFHFYPTSYTNFDRSKAFFSVKAGPFTLLSNFSALLNAQSQAQDTISREFCVNIEEDQRLNITFTPNHDIPGAYAFINGIEIVSMPSNLYYTEANTAGFNFVGQVNPYSIENNSALEMMYRINVGGQSTPEEDTGMYRSWPVDDDYLTDAQPSALPVNRSIDLNFSMIHNYTAPREVYITARSMGLDKATNEKYNLTWEFPVDSGFTYFVRLHFCEFESPVTKAFDRVFKIYIANITAEEQADVIRWSGRNGVPIYKDYAVMIGLQGSQKTKRNLSIALHPNPRWMSAYTNAILNGIEIFKVSNYYNLFAPNPDLPLMSPPPVAPPSTQSTKNKNNQTKIIAIVVGVVSGLVILSVIGFLIFRRKRKVKDSASSDGASRWGPFSSTTKSTKSRGSHLPSDLSRYFSLAEIKAATNNFDSVFIIGVGGFGNVYKGYIDGGATAVAVKRLNPGSQQGAVEFKTEIEMLSRLRHLHLVSLIGYCNDDREMILVYDYMSHGTLRDHLYNNDNPPLKWNQRLQICIGSARGLDYLHTGAKHTIIHRDVKTTNILLDEKWVAKVSDFGLSKMGPTNMSKTHISTEVKGSLGYLDPEYYRRHQLTEKSDVYSFGVVLFEVLCARPPITRMADKKQVTLAEWARQSYCNGTLDEIIDPFLKGKIAPECLKKFSEVAMSCLHDDGIERPSMSDLVWGLEFALQLQEGAEEQIMLRGPHIEVDVDKESSFRDYTTDNSSDLFSSIGEHVLDSKNTSRVTITTSDDQSVAGKDSAGLMSGLVFSEIMNPHGR